MSDKSLNQAVDCFEVDSDKGLYQKLISEGYFVIPKLLDESFLERLQGATNVLLERQDEEAGRAQLSTGSMVNVTEDPLFAELVAYPSALEVLRSFGSICPRWSSGYIISKPPDSPALFWHQDWWGWEHKSSYTDFIHQIFVMVYLTDTTRENGCLKFLPGSHRAKHKFHESKNAHSEELARVDNPNDPLFLNEKEEIDVPSKLGDIVVGDARVLHAANKNNSDKKRSLITLWYHPHYNQMTDEMRSRIYHLYARKNEDDVETDSGGMSPYDWENKYKDKINFLAPNIEKAEPTPWQRKPNWK